MYSDADKLVPGRAVSEHAEEARKKGFMVNVEKFDGTPHVNHVRQNPERYWSAVKMAWERMAPNAGQDVSDFEEVAAESL